MDNVFVDKIFQQVVGTINEEASRNSFVEKQSYMSLCQIILEKIWQKLPMIEDKEMWLMEVKRIAGRVREFFYQEIFLDQAVITAYRNYEKGLVSERNKLSIINMIDTVFCYIEQAIAHNL